MSLFNIFSISLVIDYGTQNTNILNHFEYTGRVEAGPNSDNCDIVLWALIGMTCHL